MFFLVDWINWIAGLFSGNPLLLVFILGLVGNILPFVPTPSLLIIVGLVASPGSSFQGLGIVEIASITALGACIGKLASYALGYGSRRAIGKTERFDSLRKFLGGHRLGEPSVGTKGYSAQQSHYKTTGLFFEGADQRICLRR